MRNLARIDKICNKIAKLWKYYPDERLGQFIMNHIFNDGKDPFFREDSKESWMDEDYQTWEDLIDKQLEEKRLFDRVLKETTYSKDYDKWLEADLKWLKGSGIYWSEEDLKFKEKTNKPEPTPPNWKDYIKDLKNE